MKLWLIVENDNQNVDVVLTPKDGRAASRVQFGTRIQYGVFDSLDDIGLTEVAHTPQPSFRQQLLHWIDEHNTPKREWSSNSLRSLVATYADEELEEHFKITDTGLELLA
jgi:hypothetical protein